jgi:S-adenosyl-L-methionine hydrolase (adenosine-forming)
MAAKRPVITLTTDFGLQDHFVGTMKGVIANINPEALVIDITHNVAPHDIFQAAFVLKNFYPYFPPTTIHVAIVDPGVGTNRRALVVSSEKGYFVAPDNGILSYLFAEGQVGEVREITADHYFLKPRSGTFDGRDVFAPVAAWLTKGVTPAAFGEVITDYKKYDLPQPTLAGQGVWRCRIIYVDRFGNLVSNLTREKFKEYLDASEKRRFAFQVGEQIVSKISNSYAESEKNELIVLFGSSGFLEFSVNRGNASKLTSLVAGKDILFKVM